PTSVSILKDEGYNVHSVKSTQVGTGLKTEYKFLTKPEITQKEAWLNRNNIQQIDAVSSDGGRSYDTIKPPSSISSKRIGINYKEAGGDKADGVIYVRPGVPDISLGKSNYAQVRIAVDDTHYLKGMAVYKDDMPKGVDLV